MSKSPVMETSPVTEVVMPEALVTDMKSLSADLVPNTNTCLLPKRLLQSSFHHLPDSVNQCRASKDDDDRPSDGLMVSKMNWKLGLKADVYPLSSLRLQA